MMKSTTFNRSCVSASGVTEMSTWFEASTGTFVSWLTGTGSSLTSSRLAYSFASIHAGPLQASPDPLVFSTSHGALASTPTRRTPAFLIASMRGLAPGGGTPGACASAATARNVPASAPANAFVVLVMAMLFSSFPRCPLAAGRSPAAPPAKLVGGAAIDGGRIGGGEHHAVVGGGVLRGEVAARDVARHQGGVALPRVAIAAPAWGAHRDGVAGDDADVLILRQMRRDVVAALPRDGHLVGRAVPAAEHAGRAEAPVVHQEREQGLAAAHADLVVHAEAPARPACPARALAQRVLLEQDRVVLLQHLGGLGLADADGRAAVGEAVAVAAAAVAAPAEHVHDVVPLLQRVVPAGAAKRSSGMATPSAAKTDSAMRELTSAAQPDTGRG